MIIYKKITWEEILPIWKEHLPNMSPEQTSAMGFFLATDTEHYDQPIYDLKNQSFSPTFWGAFHNSKLVGVNSGHMTLDKLYRSRGLFVFSEYRGRGIGQKLLMRTLAQARHENAIACWSYPTMSAMPTYRWMQFSTKTPFFNFQYVQSKPDSNGIVSVNIRAGHVLDLPGMVEYHTVYYRKD
jgi:GNAT superfamily N-acetyltransferase